MKVDRQDELIWEYMTDVPYVSKPVAGVSAVFNLLFPGFGTWITACVGGDTTSKT